MVGRMRSCGGLFHQRHPSELVIRRSISKMTTGVPGGWRTGEVFGIQRGKLRGAAWIWPPACHLGDPSTTAPMTRLPMFNTMTTVNSSYFGSPNPEFHAQIDDGTIVPRKFTTPLMNGGHWQCASRP